MYRRVIYNTVSVWGIRCDFNLIIKTMYSFYSMLSIPQPSARSLQHIYQVQLGRFFEDSDFTPEVKDCLFPLVSASIHMYYGMCKVMRPTPAKSHYTFNVRDLSQVCVEFSVFILFSTHNFSFILVVLYSQLTNCVLILQ